MKLISTVFWTLGVFLQGSTLQGSDNTCRSGCTSLVSSLLHTSLKTSRFSEIVLLQGNTTTKDMTHSLLSCHQKSLIPVTWFELRHQRPLEDEIENFLNLNINILGDPKLFLIDCRVHCVKELLLQANKHDSIYSEQGVFTYKNKWLLLLNTWQDLQAVQDEAGHIIHLTAVTQNDSKIYSAAFVPRGRREFHVIGGIDDVTDPGMGGVANNSLHLTDKVFPNTKYKFNGRRLRAGVNYWGPFLQKDENGTRTGLCMEVLKALAQYLNFSYELVEPPDMLWGSYENGTFTGITGQFYRKEIDLSVVPMVLSRVRSLAQDFTQAYYYEPSVVGYKRTKPRSKVDIYFRPFKSTVWLLLVLSVPVMACVLSGFTKLALSNHGNTSQNYNNRSSLRLVDSFMFSFGSVLQQGDVSMLPTSLLCLRFIISFWWLFCIIIFATYSGNIIAFLAVEEHDVPFTTLNELLDTNKYILGVPSSTVWEELFQYGSSPTYQKGWQLIEEYRAKGFPTRGDLNQQIQLMHDMDNYAVVMDMTKLNAEIADSCEIARMKETFFPMQYAVGLQKNSVYNQPISQVLQVLTEDGMVKAWRKIHTPVNRCHSDARRQKTTASMADVQGIFICLGSLIILASLILIVELLYKKNINRLTFFRQNEKHK